MSKLKVTVAGTGAKHSYVRSVLHINDAKAAPINDFVVTAAQNKSRSADYIAETLSQVSELCETNEELAYASYLTGILLGPSEEVKQGFADMLAGSN